LRYFTPDSGDALLLRVVRRARVDLEAVALGALGIGALHGGVLGAGTGDGALGVVDDHAQRHAGEPLEGAAVATQPGGHRLVPDELHILMAAVGQRHHERPGAPGLAVGVDERGAGAEVNLGGIAGLEVQAAGGLRRQLIADVGHQPAHGRVAACPAVLALQRGVDGRARDALLDPGAKLRTMRLQRGNGGAGLARAAQRGGDGGVVGQRLRQVQPARRGGDAPPLRGLGPAHDLRRGDVAVGVALAHAQQGLSIVMHLEIPARHLCAPGQKARRVEMTSL